MAATRFFLWSAIWCHILKKNKVILKLIFFEITHESRRKKIIQIIEPSCWLEIKETNSFYFKFFFVPFTQSFSIIWTSLLNSTWKIPSVDESSWAEMVEAVECPAILVCNKTGGCWNRNSHHIQPNSPIYECNYWILFSKNENKVCIV